MESQAKADLREPVPSSQHFDRSLEDLGLEIDDINVLNLASMSSSNGSSASGASGSKALDKLSSKDGPPSKRQKKEASKITLGDLPADEFQK